MKKLICLALILSLVLCSTVFVSAVDNDPMEFTKEEIELSLEGAKEMLLTSGTAIEMANINLRMNRAKTRAHYENTGRIWAMGAVPSRTMREMADLAVDFAREQTPRNFDAEINQIVRDTVKDYYTLAQLKESLRISNDDVAIQQQLYQNTQRRFELGVASKQDVLAAEIGLNQAKVREEIAENTYNNFRMVFNITFGYDLMQNITLTDLLEENPISEIPLDEAISKALDNRNEIYRDTYNLKMQELNLRETGNTISRSSAVYLQEAAKLLGAQAAYRNAPKTIEMDVKMKYTDMTQKKSEVELGSLNVSNAKERYRLANLQLEAGMATLTDTQQAQLAAYQAELNYYVALLAYNLAVIDYEQSTTVGVVSVNF